MTALEAIEILKTDMGCYECTFGCSTPYECANGGCPFREAIHLAVERLSIDILPKMIKTESDSEKPNNSTSSKMEQVDEPQTYVINPQEPTNDDECFECDDFFTCGGQCNKIEDETHTDCPWK